MKKTSLIILSLLFLITLLIYSSVLISPQTMRISGFVSLLIPVVMIVHLIIFVVYLFRPSRLMLIPMAALLIGYKFIGVTVQASSEGNGEGEFSVMSYNLKRLTDAFEDDAFEDFKDWVKQNDSDIICFQEFYGNRTTINFFRESGYYEAIRTTGRSMAIFSKYPILNSGILFEDGHQNNVIFADIKLPNDTLRVYNVHLLSMGIVLNDVHDSEEIREEYARVRGKFLNGSVGRTEQIKVLLAHSRDNPFRTIIAGDFNDVPYSYNHFMLKKTYLNAFESAGKGFGFTFKNLPFLRIDHQFYDERLKVHNYETFREIFYSDHFPIKAKYSILE